MLTATLLALLAAVPDAAAPADEVRKLLDQVSVEPSSHGELVYVGRVFALKGPRTTPRFVYQRQVQANEAGATSTCLTFDGDQVVLVDVAQHDLEYHLRAFTEYQFQTGEVGTVTVAGDVVRFHLVGPNGPQDSDERVHLPVVVGPTVYGFVSLNWGRLLAGEVIPFRYAVVNRLETFGFELSRVEAPRGQVKVTMRPSSFLVALAVRPIVITYDTQGKLLTYEGTTPMKSEGHRTSPDFEGHVDYTLVAERFR
jgi:hypothetical protein